MNEQITGALFKRMVLHGAAVITAQKQAINDLNVFPVPDGDTGTNMSLTISAAAAELKKKQCATVGEAAQTAAMYVYDNIFGFNKAGLGQAAAIIITVVLVILTYAITAVCNRLEVEE